MKKIFEFIIEFTCVNIEYAETAWRSKMRKNWKNGWGAPIDTGGQMSLFPMFTPAKREK